MKPALPYPKQSQQGFTLIELLVVISIMVLTIGGGVASYVDFNERQQVLQAGHMVENALYAARIKARAGEKPESCDILTAYAVSTVADLPEIDLKAICESGDYVVTTYRVDGGVKMQDTTEITFPTLHGGAGEGQINLSSGDKHYSISVNEGGSVRGGIVDDSLHDPTPTPTPDICYVDGQPTNCE